MTAYAVVFEISFNCSCDGSITLKSLLSSKQQWTKSYGLDQPCTIHDRDSVIDAGTICSFEICILLLLVLCQLVVSFAYDGEVDGKSRRDFLDCYGRYYCGDKSVELIA